MSAAICILLLPHSYVFGQQGFLLYGNPDLISRLGLTVFYQRMASSSDRQQCRPKYCQQIEPQTSHGLSPKLLCPVGSQGIVDINAECRSHHDSVLLA